MTAHEALGLTSAPTRPLVIPLPPEFGVFAGLALEVGRENPDGAATLAGRLRQRLAGHWASGGVCQPHAHADDHLLSEGDIDILRALADGPLPGKQLATRAGYEVGSLYHRTGRLGVLSLIHRKRGDYHLTDRGRDTLARLPGTG